MSSRVIKDTILNHPLVANLSEFTQDQFQRWILLSDDWGCFNADLDEIKGACYPKRIKVTAKVVEKVRQELFDAGFLYLWIERGIAWGYWTWWETGEFCGVRSFNKDGDRTRNRRKTPEPSVELLNAYLSTHGSVVSTLGASGSKWEQASSVPLPPVPFPDSPSGNIHTPEAAQVFGEFQHVSLTAGQYGKLLEKAKADVSLVESQINRFDRWAEESPSKTKNRVPYLTISNWIEQEIRAGPGSPVQPGKRNGGGNGKPSIAELNREATRDFVRREMARTVQPDLPDVRKDPGGLS